MYKHDFIYVNGGVDYYRLPKGLTNRFDINSDIIPILLLYKDIIELFVKHSALYNREGDSFILYENGDNIESFVVSDNFKIIYPDYEITSEDELENSILSLYFQFDGDSMVLLFIEFRHTIYYDNSIVYTKKLFLI